MYTTCKHHNHCLESALEQAEKICQKNNARLTDVRKRVLELIWAGHEPAKAYDLLTKLQKNDPSAKPPTIYRALDFLLEHGLIHKLHRLNAYIGCSHPEEKKPCFFLICTNCHTVTESNDDAYKNLIAKVSKSFHFKPKEITFEMEGLCLKCA
jgi:Fur family zinc uptake transcriptional regulator